MTTGRFWTVVKARLTATRSQALFPHLSTRQLREHLEEVQGYYDEIPKLADPDLVRVLRAALEVIDRPTQKTLTAFETARRSVSNGAEPWRNGLIQSVASLDFHGFEMT